MGSLSSTGDSPIVQWAPLASARSSKLVDAKTALGSIDSVADVMAGSDTLSVSFAAPALASGQVRDYFLVVDATRASPCFASISRMSPATSLLPTRFALRQNQPNPFSAATSIRFELPVGAMVRLEVFDAQGRRLTQLANRYFPAGYQTVEWKHVDADGHAVRPGVYFYRIEAGPFRDRKKMVLIPD